MQITLNQDEIHTAVEQYVRSQINIAPNQSINIDFTAGRGANGLSATLDIRQSTAPTKQSFGRSASKAETSSKAEEAAEAEEADEIEEEESASMDLNDVSDIDDNDDEEDDEPEEAPVAKKALFAKAS